MKISEFSVKHPVVITMCLIVLGVFGLFSLKGMPLEFMTDISTPTAIVYTIYPGASAEDVEQDVTKILEDSFVTLPNFKKVESNSSNSVSWITITYADGCDPYDQLEELRNRINGIVELLPEGIQGKPRALVGGITMLPIVSFTVSAGQDSAKITDYINKELVPKLTQIKGISGIELEGGKELELSIRLNTDELVSKGISVTKIYQILNYGNVNLPLGSVEHDNRSIQIRYAGGFNSLDDIKNLPVGVADGNNIIRLSDVAEVYLDYPKESYSVTDGINPITIVSITKRSDGDTVRIVKKVKQILEEETRNSNGALNFHIMSDDSRQVIASVKTVVGSGVMGIIFAVLVILLFLSDWRATLVIGLSIPLCILFSLIGLKLFGISLNLMSLSGLVISLGMVVDGSTVMLDQIYRYYKLRNKDGKTAYTLNQSIYKGWDEVAGSILASVATTMVVFIPIALLKGLIGDILSPVAVTIVMAIGSSFLVAVIIVPYLLKLLLREEGPKLRDKPRKFDLIMDKVEQGYKRILQWALVHSKSVIFISVGLLLFSFVLIRSLGVAFIPSTDTGDFFIAVDFPKGTKIEQTEEKMKTAMDLLYKYVPEIDNLILYTGKSQGRGIIASDTPGSAYAHVILVPVSERKRDIHDIMLQMQEIWAAVLPDSYVYVKNGGFDNLVGYVSGGGGFGITLISENMEVLYKTANGIKEFLNNDPDVIAADMDTNFDTSTMVIDMSQEYLSSLGLTSYETGITSAILFRGIDVGRYKEGSSGSRYNIRLFSDITDQEVTKDSIANVHIVTDRGQDVSFANLSDIYVENSVSQINHSDRAKTITVSATLVSENTSGVASRVRDYLSKNPLPNEVKSKAGGIMSLIGDMAAPMITAMLIAIFLVYTVMVIQFERFRQPFIILLTIPFCLIGVILGLMIFGSTLNLISLLGLISLSGVVVNNGIILVDYVNHIRVERRQKLAEKNGKANRDGEFEIELTDDQETELLKECVTDGSASRIKPILITTLTTLLGDIPMALSKGEGAEIYAPMGQAIVGGMITSTLITLILIPTLYYMTEKKKCKIKPLK